MGRRDKRRDSVRAWLKSYPSLVEQFNLLEKEFLNFYNEVYKPASGISAELDERLIKHLSKLQTQLDELENARNAIIFAIEQLEEFEKTICIKKFIHSMSDRQIAREENYSESSIRRILGSCLDRIGAVLE